MTNGWLKYVEKFQEVLIICKKIHLIAQGKS